MTLIATISEICDHSLTEFEDRKRTTHHRLHKRNDDSLRASLMCASTEHAHRYSEQHL